jgi:hypothetical protein
MQRSWVAPTLLLAAVVVVSGWVLLDARARARDRHPVVAEVFGVAIERPEAWAALCLVIFVLGVPLYVAARRAS